MATLNNTLVDSSASSNILTGENKEFYSKTLLSRLIPELKLMKYAAKPKGSTIPKNAGDTVSFRRMNSLALAKTPLVEGVTPEGQNLSLDTITATVAQYGGYVVITDKVQMMAIDPILTEAGVLLGEQAGQTTESIVSDIIFAGTNVYRAGGVASQLLTATTISEADILAVSAILKKKTVKRFSDGYYHALVPIKVANDIRQLDAWIKANTYNHDGLVSGEVGVLHGIKFIEATEDFVVKYAGAGASGADLYASLFMGKDFFGAPDIEGSAKPEIFVFQAGSNTDPLAQRATSGWKNLFTVKRLNELCAVRLESK